MAKYTEKEILMMIWQNLEDMRAYNSDRKENAIMWNNDPENKDTKTSQYEVLDISRQLSKNEICKEYIENKIRELNL